MAVVGFALLFLGLIMVGRTEAQSSFPAFLVFGDSTVDTGNNNYVNNAPRANFSPYGRDYPGGVATGRFSDGRLSIDYIASALGLKDIVPPYLQPNLTPRDLATGVTFASTASGYDPVTSDSGSAISMTQQLSYFRQYQSRLTSALGAAQTQRIVNQALYLVSAGSADLAVSYFYNPFTRGGGRRAIQYPNVNDYITFLIDQAVSFLRQLHGLGARRIMVSGLSILGCTPLQRTYLAIEGRPCNERINQASLSFNRRLSAALTNLQAQLGDVRFLFSDTYEVFLDATVNPLRYGFLDVSRGCCGSGLVEVGTACGAARITCPDAGRFIYFDSVHPSQHMYQIIAQQVIQNDVPRLV